MKKLFLLPLLFVAFVFVGCDSDDDKVIPKDDDEEEIIDDEDIIYELKLPSYDANTDYFGDLDNPEDSWEIDWGGGDMVTYYQNTITDASRIFTFNCNANLRSGVSDGFAFSNKKTGDPSAITKKGVYNDTYVTSYYSSYSDKDIAIRFVDDTNKSKAYTVDGLYTTNAYTNVDVIENGSNITPTDEFKDGDWFKLIIFDITKSKSVEFYLADFRDGKREIVKEWKWVDLSSLGETTGLKFELSSSDVGDWGMNTPAYFCLDGIKLIEKVQ